MRPSPLQNRCAPDGSLHAVAARGLFMGNRGGRLHRPDGTLGRARWRSHAWICCVTEFRGRHRQVMGDGYTEIFFLDEATALAAGHRPCFECRRAAARALAEAWPGGPPMRAPDMDRVLHHERRAPPEPVAYGAVPPGAIFAASGAFYLKSQGAAWRWSFSGYTPARAFDAKEIVAAVTPPSIRAVLSAGYRPQLHPSAQP